MRVFAAASNNTDNRRAKAWTRDQALEKRIRQTEPVILLGMHRSGTSLATRLLADLGVHMGCWLSRDAEAVFFQKLNRRIYHSAGADWAVVEPLLQAMANTDFVEKQVHVLLQSLFDRRVFLGGKPGISALFGPARWQELSADIHLPWGWKDPRTTLLFPIWLQIFTRARVVHLVRNGIDVAISTHRRSLKQKQKRRNHILPLDYKPVTLDFEYCFHLWETYVTYVLEHKSIIPGGRYLEIRYEDLLRDPLAQMRCILTFIEHPVQDEELTQACLQINRERLDNTVYARSYEAYIPELSRSPLMHTLGYS